MIGTIALTIMIAFGSLPGWKADLITASGDAMVIVTQKGIEAQCRLVWTDRSGKQWHGRITGCEEAYRHYKAMLEKKRDARIHVEVVWRRKR